MGEVGDEVHGPAPGHVTNYAQNENGRVWSLQQFASHVGGQAFARLWDRMLESTALLFAAALPRVREVQAYTAMPPQSGFQLFGLDFLVDVAGKPWLLEANATPSMKVRVVGLGGHAARQCVACRVEGPTGAPSLQPPRTRRSSTRTPTHGASSMIRNGPW